MCRMCPLKMASFLLFLGIAILQKSFADVSSDGVIMPSKCEGNFLSLKSNFIFKITKKYIKAEKEIDIVKKRSILRFFL